MIFSPVLRAISLPSGRLFNRIDIADFSIVRFSSPRCIIPNGQRACPRSASRFGDELLKSYFGVPIVFPSSRFTRGSLLDLGDLLFMSLDRTLAGDLVTTLVTTLLDEGLEDKDRSDLSFLSCLPLSVPKETAGAAVERGSFPRTSLIGLRAETFKSSFPPLPLPFLPNVAVDSDED